MQSYKISVVIPTHNTGDYLISTVDSVINQTIGFENIELLLVDDKSTDDYTIALLEEYDSKYENCRAIFLEENSGFPGTPRNIGLKNATGDCIIFMDHDDTYVLNAFENMYNKLIEEDSDFVISTYTHIYENKKSNKVINLDGLEIKITTIEDNSDFLKLPPSIWTKLFKREFLLKNNIKFIEEMLAEDVEFFIHSLLCGKNIVYMGNFSSYNYKIRESFNDKSVIHTYNKKYLNAMIDGYEKTLQTLEKYNKNEYFSIIFEEHCMNKSPIHYDDKVDLIKRISPLFLKGFKQDPNFLIEYCYPFKENILNEDYLGIVKNIEKNKRARFCICELNKYYDIFYKLEDVIEVNLDLTNIETNEILFSPYFENIFLNCELLDIASDCKIKINQVNSIHNMSYQKQSFGHHISFYKINGDFANASYIKIKYRLEIINLKEFRYLYQLRNYEKEIKKLNNENRKLNNENRKLIDKTQELTEKNKDLIIREKEMNNDIKQLKTKNDYNEKLLNTKPYRFAKILRDFSQRFK